MSVIVITGASAGVGRATAECRQLWWVTRGRWLAPALAGATLGYACLRLKRKPCSA